jgi:phenylacetate-CoA ligase
MSRRMTVNSALSSPTPSMEGNLWPAVPNQRSAIMLSLLFQLEQSQWWDPERLQAAQFRQAAEVLRHARRTTPYYAERLSDIGWRYGQPLTADIWSELPLLRREDIQDAGERLHSRALPKGHGKTGAISTSGSTGKPVRVLTTDLTTAMWVAFTLRDYIWRRCDFSAKFAAIRYDYNNTAGYPDGKQARSWGGAYGGALPTGPGAMLSITTPVANHVEWLARQDANYLITYPSNLEAILRHCQAENIRLPEMREVQTMSELLKPSVRELCQEVWGVPLTDMYTCQEAGYIALQCHGHTHYHAQAENLIVEVLNDDGSTTAPGETGKVVVTHLHNFASPLIRYDIGDFAEVGEPCPCGRGLPVFNRIDGRARGMITLPNGDQFWPFFSNRKFGEIAPIRQYQIVQKTLDNLEIRLVVEQNLSAEQEDKMRTLLTERLGHPFTMSFSYFDEIPRSTRGKFEDFKLEL